MPTTIDALISSSGCNSYIDVAGADTYFGDRLHSDGWTSASPTEKTQSLLWAAKILDTRVRWQGTRVTQSQPMAWPRAYVKDPDFSMLDPNRAYLAIGQTYQYLPTDVFPTWLKWAQCEQALALLGGDISLDSDTYGYSSLSVGAISVTINSLEASRVLPRPVRDLVSKYGETLDSGARVVRLQRS